MAKIQSELQAAHESVAEVKKRIEPPETPHITKKHNGTAAREDRPKLPGHWEQIRRRHHEATGSPSPTMRVHSEQAGGKSNSEEERGEGPPTARTETPADAQQSDQGNEQVNDVEMEEDLAEAIAGTQGDTEETDGGTFTIGTLGGMRTPYLRWTSPKSIMRRTGRGVNTSWRDHLSPQGTQRTTIDRPQSARRPTAKAAGNTEVTNARARSTSPKRRAPEDWERGDGHDSDTTSSSPKKTHREAVAVYARQNKTSDATMGKESQKNAQQQHGSHMAT
ncbi:hypothetical protein GN958_ATG01836 [Phytophthora infestans]|uniref:Uncharacterized protein n=1 Tax=Phytophthora infestans TaxID=4787 RepID=A0A8S9VCK5_PHYIN|nr:hypothetical protein GN958_ATG01836 [Phytophthora infestans]